MREMKDSGIGWVHEIPIDWDVIRGKYLFTNDKMLVGAKVEEYERLALTMKGVVKRSKDDTEGLQPDKFNTYQILRTGELVFKLIDLQNISTSRVGLSPYTGIVSPAYIILKGNEQILPEYAEKYYLMMWMNQVFNALGDSGVRSSLNVGELLELKLPVPPLEEQRRIADFLDNECGKIDSIIADVEKQIEILEQYKRSVIFETVTKGLDHSVQMKDSGIDYIGTIPECWTIEPLFIHFREGKKKNVACKEENLLSLSYGKVIRKDINSAEGLLPASFSSYNVVSEGDIIIRPTDLQNDKRSLRTGLVKEKGIITSAYIDLIPFKGVNSRYYQYLLHVYDIVKTFYNMGNGVRQGLNYDEFSKLLVLSPPKQEQQAIADYLDKKCAEIDGVIADKKEQLDVLENYKKSLIYEYVTGKKEVV